MKAWFFGLQPRERWIVGIGAVIAVIIVLWGLLVRPLLGEAASLRASVDMKEKLLIDVRRVEAERPGSSNGRLDADKTLSVIIDNTARSHGLNSPRTRANGPNGIDVTLQGASFDAVAVWLVALHDSYGIDVETASFTPAREPGIVNGSLLLRRL
jgi:general secretion pathway protein M